MTNNRLNIAKEAALQTGKQLLDTFISGKYEGEVKADHTLVTTADRKADLDIQALIQANFPEDEILSEEKSTVFPPSEHTWVIDPLDGTVNFSLGLHYWGVSIAHLHNGKPVDAAVYFPVIDEMYSASLGKGSELNGKLLQVPDNPEDTLFSIFVHCSRMHQRYHVKSRHKTRSLGAAAYHLCLVAKSSASVAFESTAKIWDFAASWLIIKEAGGVIQAIGKKQPFPAEPGKDYLTVPCAILAAGSERLYQETLSGMTKR